MTAFSLETTQKMAHLARLSLSDEELQKYVPQLQQILTFVEQLAEVDTKNVAPLANVANMPLHLRDDVVNDGDVQADILANAPESVEGYFVVQKVVE